MNEYLGEDALKLIVSPPRVGYLVPKGDGDAFEEAVTIASSRWGGVTEPILSLWTDGTVSPADSQIAEMLDLVALVNIGCPPQFTTGGVRGLDLPVVDRSSLERAAGLRSLPWHVGARSATDYVAARPHGQLWEKVAAGVDSRSPHRGSAGTEDNAGRAALSSRSLLDAGLAGLAESEAVNARSGPVLVWITEPDALTDCQLFWNFRALRCLRWPASPTYLLPEHALSDWLGLEETLRSMIRERQFAGGPDLVINSLSVDDSRLRAIGDQLGLDYEPSKELTTTSVASIVDPSPRNAFTFTTDIDARDWLLFDRTLGYDEWLRVQTFREGTSIPVLPESLAAVVRDHPGVPLRLRLSGGYLQDLPRTPSTARAVLDAAAWSGPHLQCTVGISAKGLLKVNAPSQEQVLNLVTRDVPGKAELSDKGRLAASLVKRHDVEILSAAPTVAAIQALTTRRSKELLKQLSRLTSSMPTEIVDLVSSLGGRVERNYRSARNLDARGLPATGAAEVLEQLSDAGWLERGFKVSCQTCGLQSFIPTTSAPSRTVCPQCAARSQLARTGTGLEVYYRLDPFADRCSDQGVITHAAVGSVLLAAHPFSALHLGTEIEWEDGTLAEVDILGFLGPRVVAGEIKTSAAEFTKAQIQRDIALSARLGAQTHVLAYIWPPPDLTFLDQARTECDAAGLELLLVRPNEDRQLAVTSRR